MYDHSKCIISVGRSGTVPIWNAYDECRSGNGCRGPLESHSGKADQQPPARCCRRSRHHCRYPKLLCHNRYGCRLCEQRTDDAESGSLDYYGGQYRHDDYRAADCPGCLPHCPAGCHHRCCHGDLPERKAHQFHWRHSRRAWNIVYRYGYDVQFHDTAAGLSCIPECHDLHFQSAACDCSGSRFYCTDSKLLRIRGNITGSGFERTDSTVQLDLYHLRTEYRYLHYRRAGIPECEPKCQADNHYSLIL